jgi:23S rRNA (pseudouridine1915-N3)-methyltransferase
VKLRMIAAGTRLPAWVNEGFEEYASRLPRECPLELKQIPLGRRPRRGGSGNAVREEGDRMLAALDGEREVVALEVTGKALSTAELAARLAIWRREGGDVAFLVGGPDGLDPRVLARAGLKWSLSRLTLPHGLVRVVVAEALYRAHTLLAGHPYHRP